MNTIVTASLSILALLVPQIPSQPVVYQSVEVIKIPSTDDLIEKASIDYSVSKDVLKRIIQCESGGREDAHNLTKDEDSWGLVQLNLKAHPYITKEQALDPEFSIRFLAENLKNNKGYLWTCWKKVT